MKSWVVDEKWRHLNQVNLLMIFNLTPKSGKNLTIQEMMKETVKLPPQQEQNKRKGK